jgi:hypothetical protein
MAEAQRSEQERYLLDGLAESLSRGHYRVALRRYFMLVAREFRVPEDIRPKMEQAAQRCKPEELRRMADSGRAWAAMVSRRGTW